MERAPRDAAADPTSIPPVHVLAPGASVPGVPTSERASAPARAPGKHIIFAILFGVAASVLVAFLSDIRDVADAIAAFDLRWIAPALGLGLAAHAIRWVRWHWALRRSTLDPAEQLSVRDSVTVFAAGYAMVVTPGLVGEWIKSFYIRALGGAPVARTAPIILAERITDTLGLVVLATAGVFIFHEAGYIVIASAAISLAILFAVTNRRAARFVSGVIARIPLVRRVVPHTEVFYLSSSDLMNVRTVPAMTAIAFVAYLGETLAYWCVLLGIGIEPTSATLMQGAFVWAAAQLAGGLLMTPGGLGVAEGGLTAFGSTLITGLARGPAAAAGLLGRLVTLWLGVAIGVTAMLLLAHRLTREPRPAEPSTEARG